MTEVQVIKTIEDKVIARYNYKQQFNHNNIKEIEANGKLYGVISKVISFEQDKIVVKFYV